MAISFDALNQVYNHYLAEYAPKSNTSLDTHKKSDLRSIYNSIVKLNKDAPLYILDTSDDSKSYAVGLKESARSFRNSVISTQRNLDEGGVLEQKIAYSSRPEIASAKYINIGEDNSNAPIFNLEVASLASPQVNMGNSLRSDQKINLPPDTYSFDVSVHDLNYEFQFELNEDDTHLDIQNRLSRLINSAQIGLNASVLEDDQGNSMLKLESDATGKPEHSDYLFRISDDNTSKASGVVDYLGIQEVTREPANALFEINGIERKANSNTFTVEKMYEITLNAPSPETGITTEIGLKDDIDSVFENVHALADSYNDFVNSVSPTLNNEGTHTKSSVLLNELGYITRNYAADLEHIGLTFDGSGRISVNDQKLSDMMNESDASEQLSVAKDFANSMLRKSYQIALNPMQYVNKTIVAYKNPGKNYPSPYTTSAYSGMLFNNYC